MKRLLLSALVFAALSGCGDDQERKCRVAVKSLVAAPAAKAAGELEKVLAFGRYALPDIEQEFHAAPLGGRRRLLEAIEKLRLPEAAPFVEFVARRDSDPTLRAQAGKLGPRLRSAQR